MANAQGNGDAEGMVAVKERAKHGEVPARLYHRLRADLVAVLAEGSWDRIKEAHKKVGLGWREDLGPGWGKPKYVERVLEEIAEDALVAVARRAVERFPEQCAFALTDTLHWIDARGVARVTEVTRMAVASALEGFRVHPDQSPTDVLGQFARSSAGHRFEYSADGSLYMIETDPFALFGSRAREERRAPSNHLLLLDAYSFREWPDARLFAFIEFLVHPTVRRGDEQTRLVDAFNGVLAADGFELAADEQLSGHPVFKVRPIARGVAGRPKNLIFASTGPKPELAFADAVNNDIVIVRHREHCLVYDVPIALDGLRWSELVAWWAHREGLDPEAVETRRSLGDRLRRSLASEPEKRFFKAYFKIFREELGDALPALVPQVYLHYDPMTLRELRARGDERRFDVQRMDFLLLLPQATRVVIEIDGRQHYSTGEGPDAKPSPEEYGRTVRGDRHLRLAATKSIVSAATSCATSGSVRRP